MGGATADGARRGRARHRKRGARRHRETAERRHVRRHPWLRRLAIAAAVAVLVVVAAVGSLLAAVPSVSDAPRLVADYLEAHHAPAVPVPPPHRIAEAVVATEDHAMGSLPGVDIVYGALRYVYAHVLLGRQNQGGATIPQQLAKRVYTGPHLAWSTKVEQVGLALKLEITYSTNELLALYLDEGYYGQDAYGIEQASQVYFGRTASELSWAQAAMLAGLLQAPTAYDPVVHKKLGRQRQLEVIGELVRIGVLSAREAAAVARQPLGLRP